MNRGFLLMAGLFLLLVPGLATAQSPSPDGGQIFDTFHFKDLVFQIYPAGLENRQDSDGKGSAITVHVGNVTITGYDAQDLRHCIDGDTNWCPYSIPPTGNNDGTVTSNEIASFQSLVQIGLRKYVPKVNDLLNTLQKNITVDGQASTLSHTRITKAVFVGAEGKVDRNDTILADIDAKVTYDNDAKATKHSLHLGDLKLSPDFVYGDVRWSLGAGGWHFDTGATAPAGAKSLVNNQGWFSAQGPFEDLSSKGVDLAIAKGGSSHRSPGIETVPLLAAIALVAWVGRRK